MTTLWLEPQNPRRRRLLEEILAGAKLRNEPDRSRAMVTSYPHGRPPLVLVARAGSSRPVMKAFGKAIYQGTKIRRPVYFPNGTYLTTAIWNFASNDAYFTFKDDALFLTSGARKCRSRKNPGTKLRSQN